MAYTSTDALKTSTFASLLSARPYIRDAYYDELQAIPTIYDKSHVVESSTLAVEREDVVGEFEAWSSTAKTEAAEFSYNNTAIGTTISYTAATYTNAFDVSEELLEDNQWKGIVSKAQDKAKGAIALLESKAVSVYDNAFTSGTGADGSYLCSSSHNLINSTSTGDNAETAALSASALDSMQQLADKMVNEGNIYVRVNYDILMVPVELRRVAEELIGSDKTPEDANNSKNVEYGKYKVLVNPYLSSSTAFFLIASGNANKRKPKVFHRVKPQLRMVTDVHSGNPCFQGRMRFSYGFTGWQDVIGSTGVA